MSGQSTNGDGHDQDNAHEQGEAPKVEAPGGDIPAGGGDALRHDAPAAENGAQRASRRAGKKGGVIRKPEPDRPLTARERLHLLDLWLRSGLPAGDFASLVGMSKHTLYSWKKRF